MILPSYQVGYARSAADALHTELWRNLIFSIAPELGHSGLSLRDVAGPNLGVLTNIDPSVAWSMSGRGPGDTLRHPGMSLLLDGDDDFVELGSIAASNPLSLNNGEYTLASWFLHKTGGDDFQRVIDKSNAGSALNGWAFEMQGDFFGGGGGWGPTELFFDVDGATPMRSGANAYSLDEWTHAVVLYSPVAARMRLFVNGVENTGISTLASTIPSDTINCRIGTWNHTVGREFGGNIGGLAIWNRHLSIAEVRLLYGDSLALFRRRSRVSVIAPAGTPVSSANTGQAESLQGIDSANSGQAESLQGIDAPNIGQSESLQGITALNTGQAETIETVSTSITGQSESLQRIDSPSIGQSESLQGITALNTGQAETIETVSTSITGQSESLQRIDSPSIGQSESLQGITALNTGQAESLGPQAVSNSVTGQTEVLQGILSSVVGQAESLQGIDSVNISQAESLQGVDAANTGQTEVLVSVISVNTGQTEALGTISVSNSVTGQVEALQGLTSPMAGQAEALASLIVSTTGQAEVLSQVLGFTTGQVEALQGLFAPNTGQVESTFTGPILGRILTGEITCAPFLIGIITCKPFHERVINMPTFGTVIHDIVIGDDVSIRRTINFASTGFESGTVITKAWITMKAELDDADPGIFQKAITTSDLPGTGQIENDGVGDVNMVVRFDLLPADTIAIGLRLRHWGIQVRTAAGRIYTPEKGRMVCIREVTKAMS